MPLTTAQMVRGRLNDPWRDGEETLLPSGSASSFKLQQGAPYSTLISATASVFLPLPTGWSATACTFDLARGRVTFSGVISANSALQMNYLWAVFSDDEMAYFTAVGAGVAGAALEGVKWLMGDAWKRARWGAPDGTTYDDSKALDNLRKLYDTLLDETLGGQAGPEGGYESWAAEQENH
jgi:hypothetical protein